MKNTIIFLEDPTLSTYEPLEKLIVDLIDGSKFAANGIDYWSASRDLQEVVMPNGILTGGTVTPGAVNDTIDITELVCWLNGSQVTVGATTGKLITRGVTNGFIINAVTIDNAGSVVVIAGVENTVFSTTIGAAGGPPYIPIDSILVSMVYLTNTTSVKILTTEIKEGRGQHKEMALFPTWDVIYSSGTVKFYSPLPTIHTGDLPKCVYASYASVIIPDSFQKLLYTDNFEIPEEIYSKNEINYHDNKKLIEINTALSACKFNISFKEDSGIGSIVNDARGDKRWVLVYPDQFRSAGFLCPPALLSLKRNVINAEGPFTSATVTMLMESPAIEFS